MQIDELFDSNLLYEDNIEIISTAGHTKGHISFYIPSLKTLIANDAVVIEQGEFNIANPQFTLDLKEAVKSVEKIKNLEVDKVICYHGGEMREGISEKFETLLKKYHFGN